MAKRVKRVFSSWSQVFHVWAQQNQDTGRSSNSRFDGAVLYSYSTPIATFIERKRNKKKTLKAVLVSTVKYSKTTSVQQSAIPRVLKSDIAVIYCRHIGVTGGSTPYCHDMHTDNIADYRIDYDDFVTKYTKAKDLNILNFYFNEANRIKSQAETYCEFFGLRFKPSLFKPIPQTERDKALERAAKYRESCERQRKVAQEKRRVNVVENIFDFINGTTAYLHYDWKSFATEDQINKVTSIYNLMWIRGERVNARVFDTIKLRVKGDNIETSEGASFPISHAVKAFPMVKACVDNKRDWFTNGHSIHLGSFRIDSINQDGTVKAGCHTVLYSEIERIAQELGLINHGNITGNTNNSSDNTKVG